MTAQEMVIALQVKLNKLNTTQTRAYAVQELEFYLNQAQDRFIAKKVRKKDNQLEYDVLDAEAIDAILVIDQPISYKNNKVTLPTDLQYLVRETVKDKCGNIPVNLLKSFSVQLVNQTPFYKSSNRKCNAELAGNTIILYPQKNTNPTGTLLVSFTRKPKVISVSSSTACELRDTYHIDIVDLAVLLMKTANMSPDVQLASSEVMTNSVKQL